jgi:PAS domain S-box-containing protein
MRNRRLTNITDHYHENENYKMYESDYYDTTLKNLSTMKVSDIYTVIRLNIRRAFGLLDEQKHVLCVSPKWSELCLYSQSEVYGKKLSILQRDNEHSFKLKQFESDLNETGYSEIILKNYRKNGEQFVNYIRAYVLDTSKEEVKLNIPTYLFETIELPNI